MEARKQKTVSEWIDTSIYTFAYNLNLIHAGQSKETNNLRAHHQPWRRSV